MDKLKRTYPTMILNKSIRGGSSRRRPDGLLRFKHFAIVIEIDERRHAYYDYADENLRMIDIYRDLKNIPTIFIRFNPDKYYRDGVCFYGCFDTHYNRDHEIEHRYNRLCYYIDKYIHRPPTDGIFVKKLFYSTQTPFIPSTDIDMDLLRELDAISA